MANSLDPIVSADNDDDILVTPMISQINATTGVRGSVKLEGRTDGVYFLATEADTDTEVEPIHADLVVELTEATVGGIYFGVMQGSVKSAHLQAIAPGQTLYRHVQFGQDYHVSVAAKFLPRTAY